MVADGARLQLHARRARHPRLLIAIQRGGRIIGGIRQHRREADGILERVIYRELFLDGLTVEDLPALSEAGPVSLSHVAARQELRNLVACVGAVQRQVA